MKVMNTDEVKIEEVEETTNVNEEPVADPATENTGNEGEGDNGSGDDDQNPDDQNPEDDGTDGEGNGGRPNQGIGIGGPNNPVKP